MALHLMKLILRILARSIGGVLGKVTSRRLLALLIQEWTPATVRESLEFLFALEDEIEQGIANKALEYGSGIHPKHRLMNYHQFFIDRLEPGSSVLDVGCGRGAVAAALVHAKNVTVTGIDEVPDVIARARKAFVHERLTFVEGRVPEDLPGGHFDTVVLSNVLEHVEDRVGLLRILRESVSPEQYLIRLPLFDRHWTIPLRAELGIDYFSDSTHFAELTSEGWIKEIEAAGLQVSEYVIHFGEIWLTAVSIFTP